jgi:hypothetical protein
LILNKTKEGKTKESIGRRKNKNQKFHMRCMKEKSKAQKCSAVQCSAVLFMCGVT